MGCRAQTDLPKKTMPQNRQKPIPFNRTKSDLQTAPNQPKTRPQNTRDYRPRPPGTRKVDAPSTHHPSSGSLGPFSNGFEGLFSGGLGGPFSDGFGDLFSVDYRGLVLDDFGKSVCTLQPIKKPYPKTIKTMSPLTVQKRTPKPPQTNQKPDLPEHTRLPAETSGYYEG